MGLNAFLLMVLAFISILYMACVVARALGLSETAYERKAVSKDYREIYRAVEPREI